MLGLFLSLLLRIFGDLFWCFYVLFYLVSSLFSFVFVFGAGIGVGVGVVEEDAFVELLVLACATLLFTLPVFTCFPYVKPSSTQ